MTQDITGDQAGIVTKLSPRSVPDTVARLTDLLSGKELKLFAVIDHGAGALSAGLELGDEVVVIFGNRLDQLGMESFRLFLQIGD